MDALLNQTRNIYCVGRNYRDHATELGNPIPREPVIFAKSLSSLSWCDRPCFPASLGSVHFELEWFVRIGCNVALGAYRPGMDVVSHHGIGIDFTARDYQSRLKKAGLPWHLAKNFQNACLIIGWKKGVPESDDAINFQLIQNGITRQQGDRHRMMFDVPDLLEFLNQTIPLCAGDLLFTGTPQGVGPVQSGDHLRIICPSLDIDRTLTINDQPKGT